MPSLARKALFAGLLLGAALLLGPALPVLSAQDIYLEKGQKPEPKFVVVPYVFYNESLEFGAGPALVSSGFPQPQMSIVGTGFFTTNGSRAFFLLGSGMQMPLLDRLFLDSHLSFAKFEEFESYTGGNPDYPDERAGSNDSSEDNFIETSGEDDFMRARLNYLLPIGFGRDTIINTYMLDRGLLEKGASGGESYWNPFVSGRTYVNVDLFYRNQDLEAEEKAIDDVDLRTNGVTLGLRWDNRDFVANPSRGNTVWLGVTRDFGAMDSTSEWTVLEAEYGHYLDLGRSRWFRQSVLALNAWTANAITWDRGDPPQRPPLFAGASLGGLFRQRGFPEGRFWDQAAVNYVAELRLIPDWNPVGRDSAIGWLEVDWMQVSPFVEAGRVAPRWTLRELHKDMKWTYGLGLRAMVKHVVIRVDLAFSDEGGKVQMMVDHPF